MRQIVQQCTARVPSDVFALDFSPNGTLLAAGCEDSTVKVFDPNDGHQLYSMKCGTAESLPVTGLAFRPERAGMTDNVLLVACTDGSVEHWHVTSQKRLHRLIEKGNQVFGCAYRQDGLQFATVGKDRSVRIYDENTRDLVQEMKADAISGSGGHGNRVFAVKFVPNKSNLVVSGGWDNTIQVWDVRAGAAITTIFGPHICGKSVDVSHDGIMLTGSWRPKDQIELWNLRSGERQTTIDFNRTEQAESAMIYAAGFSDDPAQSLIAAGGSGSNCTKVFDRLNKNRLVGTIWHTGSVFALSMYKDELIASAGHDSSIKICRVVEGEPLPESSQEQESKAGDQNTTTEAVSNSIIDSTISATSSASNEEKDADEGFGTSSGVVGGSGFAAARARRAEYVHGSDAGSAGAGHG